MHPIIVTALFGSEDFAEFDRLRCAHFPPERNQLRAHLTMFHHLAPALESEILKVLRDLASGPPPPARLSEIMFLGKGVAYRIESPELVAIRAEIADRFAAYLMPQDRAGWRPHVTIQNKVTAPEAKALAATLALGFQPRPVVIAGLAAFHYLGGPWQPIAAYRFGSGHSMAAPH